MASITFLIDDEEKAALEAEAAAQRISLSLLIYRRAMQKPDAQRPRGRRPKISQTQPEEFEYAS